MPNFPIIDAHVHFWDPFKFHYPWLKDVPDLNRSFLPEDFSEASKSLQVEKMVFVQCDCDNSQYFQEVNWVTSLARQDPRISGMVAWAPLENGKQVRSELEELKRRNPLLKGIRRILQDEHLEFCLQPDFVKGVTLLEEYDLTFDICIYARHLPSIIRFVEQVPRVKMVLDHIGKPDIKGGVYESWSRDITILSEFDNVHCKLSSLATEADHKSWSINDLKPYVDHILSNFGEDRCFFGGDWPVCNLAADLDTCVSTLDLLLEGFSETQQHKIYNTNATSFYNL
ncbi:MAG: amidohydrolase family protein [Cyclobacteriaceae bacterium]|nr:amidohydrolase family protein [Cyclobacteriaceae bacterium HetDA_MAG_MS6]